MLGSLSQIRVMALLGAFALPLVPLMASAECSERTVKQMAREGETVASIARSCSISKDKVQSILDDDRKTTDDRGLPSGVSVGQCGCWGYADPSMRQRHPKCRNGYARPQMCNAICPGGGFAWKGVCA